MILLLIGASLGLSLYAFILMALNAKVEEGRSIVPITKVDLRV